MRLFSPRSRRLTSLALLLTTLAIGCEGEKRYVPKKTASGALATEPAPAARAEPAPPPVQTRPILGRTTSEIKDAPTEVEKGGAQVSSGKIVAKDPITLVGNAYVTSVGKVAVGQIQHSMDLYHAQNERYPANLDEFKAEIIKPNNIRLPQLPYYQEYGYDSNTHSLVVLEYPDRKAQFQQQQDKALGRTP